MVFTLKPICGKGFVNREELIKEMIWTLSQKDIQMGFALYGKRRMGKSSLFLEINRRLKEKKQIVPVYFSLWELVEYTIEEFVEKFSSAILEAYQERISLKTRVKDIFELPLKFIREITNRLKVSLKLREDISVILTFKKERKERMVDLIEEVFMLAENLAKETKTRCLLFIDEFPSLMELKNSTKLGENIIRKIRTIHEKQKHTILNITGSVRKTMELVAVTSASAFYKQFIMRKISKLEKKDVKSLLEQNLKSEISEEILNKIYDFTQGIPFYIHFIGREIKRTEQIDLEVIKKAMEQFLEEEGNLFFKEELKKLGFKEQTIVITMVKHNLNNLSEIAKKLNEPTGTISQFLSYLEEKGVVQKKERGTYFLEDPVFQLWLRRKVE